MHWTDKKKRSFFIAIGLILFISLSANYFLYQQKTEAESIVNETKNEQLIDSIYKSNMIVHWGYNALATGNEQTKQDNLEKIRNNSSDFESAIRKLRRYDSFTNLSQLYTDFSSLNDNTMSLVGWIQEEGFTEETEDLLISMMDEYQRLHEKLNDIHINLKDDDYDKIESHLTEIDKYTENNDFYQYGYVDSLKDDGKDSDEEERFQIDLDDRMDTEELVEEKQDESKAIAKEHLQGQLDLHGLDHEITRTGQGADTPARYTVEFREHDRAELEINKYDEVIEHKIVCGDRNSYNDTNMAEYIVVDEINLDKREAVTKAKDFLTENVGLQEDEFFLDGLKKEDGKVELTFLEKWDDILTRRRTIDMTVTLDDGTIEEFRRRDFLKEKLEYMKENLASHEIKVDVDEAKEQLNPRNEVLAEGQLYALSDELLWRFPVRVKDGYRFVLINAETGEEYTINNMSEDQALKYKKQNGGV
ncbi:hypothetical protein [Natranaerobius thermophilus]|uniref:Germination protein YpeB n=1 Tax=Natranaerobius thermophilus (strain ATCC BAA-1301 / DSM 18059 / JW/NM-WN-LF) TaxID=457570 RepID=B2A1W0_NATTJ|nr:hypothetical protein [Natranaerobius thermophilus]ACB86157.1 hypothetical protein Nther_2601 [Natranaerobius thermophilus JW/NM-WN-LF]